MTYSFALFPLKPIFHCDAKYLASGVGVGQCPRRQNFALEIPTCWYILALPNAKICVIPYAKPQRQPVEYSLRWVLGVGSRVGHVHFIFFVSISFALGSVFPVEYGLNASKPPLKPIFHWKWGSRWVPNANEIYTKNMKYTCPTPAFCVGTQHNLYSTDWRRGLSLGLTQILGLASGVWRRVMNIFTF